MTHTTFKKTRYQTTLTPFLAQTFPYKFIMLVTMLIEKRLNFLNIKSDFRSRSQFLRYFVKKLPYFYQFFEISGIIDQPGFTRFSQNDCQKYRLISNMQLQVHTCKRTSLIIHKKVKKPSYIMTIFRPLHPPLFFGP